MIDSIKKYLSHNFHNPNYFWLMVVSILIVLVPPFLEMIDYGNVILNLLFGVLMFIGAIYNTTHFKELIFCCIIGLTGFTLFVLNEYIGLGWEVASMLLNLFFFLYLFVKLMFFLLKEEEVDRNTIFACISGFFLLGISGSLLLNLIHILIPDAFILPEYPNFYDFIYFSFITLTSVGFGDIVPSASPAKSLTLLLGIVGQLYTTFLVAIIVGKYLANHS